MRSRAVLALLRAQATHPGAAFPFACAAPSIACAPSASSSTGHTVLPSPPPPSSLLSGIFGQGPQGYGAPHGHLRDERIEELLGLTHIDIFGLDMDMGVGGGNRSESEKLRDLIFQKLYEPTETTTFSSPMIAADVNLKNTDKRHSVVGMWSAPRQLWVRSFSSNCKLDQGELKRIGDSVDQILEVNKQFLKLAQENLPNKAAVTSSSRPVSDPESVVKTQDKVVHVPAPLSSKALLVLSIAESIVKMLVEWVTKESSWYAPLMGLQVLIKLAKDPTAKATLDKLIGDRDFFPTFMQEVRTKNEKVAVRARLTEASLVAVRARLEQVKRTMIDALAMVDRLFFPIIIVQIVAGVLYVLAQVTW